jgi:hypothetical protein
MKNNKRGKPALLQSEKRTNKFLVSFNAEELERMLALMDETGFDSPAIFLRSSGLRSQLPAKVVLGTQRVEMYKLLSSSIKGLDLAIQQDCHKQSIKIVRDHLVQIVNALLSVEETEGGEQ